jgi:hypothetical protein
MQICFLSLPVLYKLASKRRWEGATSYSGFLVFTSSFQCLSLVLLTFINNMNFLYPHLPILPHDDLQFPGNDIISFLFVTE